MSDVIVGVKAMLDAEPTIEVPSVSVSTSVAILPVVDVVRAGIQWDRGFVKSKVKNTSADEHVLTMFPRITRVGKLGLKDEIYPYLLHCARRSQDETIHSPAKDLPRNDDGRSFTEQMHSKSSATHSAVEPLESVL